MVFHRPPPARTGAGLATGLVGRSLSRRYLDGELLRSGGSHGRRRKARLLHGNVDPRGLQPRHLVPGSRGRAECGGLTGVRRPRERPRIERSRIQLQLTPIRDEFATGHIVLERPCLGQRVLRRLSLKGDVWVELELKRERQTRRKAGTQSYRSKGASL